ncbi:TonB-dependent receptor domain-containing protein [Methylibium petroleiphilum]|uniref:TonB-dependent receptor domain-containing protein n=1 Tax=Methylibium petroleiphilum TaxID=105560 RepID=UPI001AC09534|nr:TonB-dependent receptor [Methylibium petroleiphilum]MBN9206278.1 TonB-dependent receptor [Methylibium petroleiphilum]
MYSLATSAPCAPLALSVLCLAALASIAPSAAAQAQLDPIVVTATREPQPLDRVTSDLVVIDAQRIRDSAADSVEDLLRREAGVQVSRNGGPGHAAGVLIRGSSASSTVVLIDGVRVGSATLGQAALEALSLAQIERIEVLRGPGSSLYGADAVGGVVQIFTRRGDGAPRFSAHAAVGGKSSREGDLAVSGATGGFDYAASLSHERSDGVSTLRPGDQFGNYNPDADGFRRNTGQLRLGFTPAQGHRIGLQALESRLNSQYDASEFLPPTFAQDPSPDFRDRLKTRVFALDYRGKLSELWTTTAQLSRNDDQSRTGGTVIDHFKTRRDQLSWQNALNFSTDQQLVLALERLEEEVDASGFVPDLKRDNNAVVIGYTGKFGDHVLQADLRHDDNSVYDGVTTGRLGWSLELMRGLRLRALYGTSFRAPTFNDLYYPGYGVDSIAPERGRSAEVGVNWQSGGSEAAVTVFHNRVRDLILYQPDRTFCPADPAFDFGCAGNVSRARLQGVTLSAGQTWSGFTLRGTVDFLDATDQNTGDRLNRRAAHQEAVHADYTVGSWTAGASVLNVGSRPDGSARLGGYTALDLRAKWRFAPQWQLEAKLLNATDRDIEPARDYQDLGRQAWIGVRFDGQGL